MWVRYVLFYRMGEIRTAHAVAKSRKIVSIASVCCTCGSTLLAHTVLTVANCQRMLRIRQQFACICCVYGSNLLAYTEHTVTNPQIYCALLAYAAHAAANCQSMLHMRQQFARVDGTCGSKIKMARISLICKKCKIFISSLKSSNYRDFMILKKSLKSKRSKSHIGAPLNSISDPILKGR